MADPPQEMEVTGATTVTETTGLDLEATVLMAGEAMEEMDMRNRANHATVRLIMAVSKFIRTVWSKDKSWP